MASTRTITKSARKVSIATAPNPPHPSSDRPSGIVYFWSALGVAIIALFVNNIFRWTRSPDFVRSDPGPDPYPYLAILRGTEALSCLIFVLLGTHTLILPWIRRGAPSLDGKLFLGGVSASTLDILFASFQPTWAMNAYGLAYGSWSRSIPLFPGPGAHQVPWGLLWCLPAYIWLGVGAAIFGCSILNALRRKFPGMSTMASYAVVQGAYYSIFFGLATFWNRHQVYTYVSAPRALTAWYGEVHQLPLYEPFLIGLYCWGYTWLRLSRDSRDRCAIDREVDDLQISGFKKEVLSTLAVCGWAAVVTVVAYMIPFSWLSMLGDGHPVLPSFLQQGIWCGQPGGPICPGQMLKAMRDNGV